MTEMKRPQRNYHVFFALLCAVIIIWLFIVTVNGQIFLWLPQGNLGVLRSATEAQIMNVRLQAEVTNINFSEPGTYRIISNSSRVYATHLSLRSNTTQEEIPLTVIDRTRYEPYDTELLQGIPLIDVEIEEPGRYQIVVSNLNVTNIQPIITLFPDYTKQNRLRLAGSGLVLLLVIGFFWYRSTRSLVPKEQKVEKRDKWRDFMDENKAA